MTMEHLYETETMAELCARQGRLSEAIAIFRELANTAPDPNTRSRAKARLNALQATWQPLRVTDVPPADLALPAIPGVSVLVGEDQVTVAWALPPATRSPALDVLVLQRTPNGIDPQKKLIPLTETSGRLGLLLPGLHSALAAAGGVHEGRFVPLVQSTR
ncbi:MAG TPA: hypothetical protein VF518_00305 [Polyangia bacterium]